MILARETFPWEKEGGSEKSRIGLVMGTAACLVIGQINDITGRKSWQSIFDPEGLSVRVNQFSVLAQHACLVNVEHGEHAVDGVDLVLDGGLPLWVRSASPPGPKIGDMIIEPLSLDHAAMELDLDLMDPGLQPGR